MATWPPLSQPSTAIGRVSFTLWGFTVPHRKGRRVDRSYIAAGCLHSEVDKRDTMPGCSLRSGGRGALVIFRGRFKIIAAMLDVRSFADCYFLGHGRAHLRQQFVISTNYQCQWTLKGLDRRSKRRQKHANRGERPPRCFYRVPRP
jgi:hypothetical protein